MLSKWTKDKPKVAGMYWYCDPSKESVIYQMDVGRYTPEWPLCVMHFPMGTDLKELPGYWMPIEYPEPPKEG